MKYSRCIPGLLAAVGMVLLSCAATMAASKGTAQKKGFNVSAYVVKGYSARGPIRVVSVDTAKQYLTLYSQPKSVTMRLKGRSVTVTNLNKEGLSLTDLKQGMQVYVLQKGKQVIVVALPPREVRNDQ